MKVVIFYLNWMQQNMYTDREIVNDGDALLAINEWASKRIEQKKKSVHKTHRYLNWTVQISHNVGWSGFSRVKISLHTFENIEF